MTTNKNNFDELNEKYNSGNYTIYVKGARWFKPHEDNFPEIYYNYKFVFIHNKHLEIAEYILNNRECVVEEYRWSDLVVPFDSNCSSDFFETYQESHIYRIA